MSGISEMTDWWIVARNFSHDKHKYLIYDNYRDAYNAYLALCSKRRKYQDIWLGQLTAESVDTNIRDRWPDGERMENNRPQGR